jgi:16S rRNA (uracil1498-N3)-methyltransferase
MRLSRLYTDARLEPGQELWLDGQVGHYVFRVLKLRAGDPVVLFNGDGSDYAAELLSNRRDAVSLRVTARLPAIPESRLAITLVQAVGKGDRMDLALQKSTELGVTAVQPLFSERTEVRLEGERREKRAEHWRRVLTSACEQCGRARVPNLHEPLSLDEWLVAEHEGDRVVLDPTSEASLAAWTPDSGQVSVLVGPEGGFSDRELKMLRLAGVRALAMGPRILRTETAGPAAIAILQALHGDLGGIAP